MTESVRFIHVADLHLGAPVRGVCDAGPEWAARLQRAIPEAFERVIDAALAREVDFVVLAGDAFDTSRPSYGDYLRFFEGLERLDAAGIPVYLVTGNHDPFTSWGRSVERLPASARLLGVNGPEFAVFERDGEPVCLIGGRSYYNQTWPADESIAAGITRAAAEEALGAQAARAPFSVGVIHTGLDVDASKAPAEPAELLASGIDYWACGHLHKRRALPSEDEPRIVFSGCVQGRDVRETGERGCYLVELTMRHWGGGNVSSHSDETFPPPQCLIEFIPTSSVVFQQVEVDVGACRTLADVVRLVETELFHENGKVHCDEMVVRVALTGETALHEFLVRDEVIDDLRNHINNAYPSFFCDVLRDRTWPAGGGEEPAGAFPAIVGEIADEERGREDVLINYVQSELVKRGIAVPASLGSRIGEFDAAADRIVLDLLQEGRA